MITKRKDPDVLDTSKPLLEAPVYPNFPENTPEGRAPKDDPDLFRKEDNNIDNVSDDFNDDVTDNLNEDNTGED